MLKINPGDTTATPLWLLISASLFLVLRVAASIYEAQHPPVPKELIAWKENVQISKQIEGKPLLYYFRADWSPSCLQFENDSFHNPEIVETINKSFVPMRLSDTLKPLVTDHNKAKELIQKYAVSIFPSIVIALPDGTIIDEFPGAVKHKALQKELESTVKTFKARTGNGSVCSRRF